MTKDEMCERMLKLEYDRKKALAYCYKAGRVSCILKERLRALLDTDSEIKDNIDYDSEIADCEALAASVSELIECAVCYLE